MECYLIFEIAMIHSMNSCYFAELRNTFIRKFIEENVCKAHMTAINSEYAVILFKLVCSLIHTGAWSHMENSNTIIRDMDWNNYIIKTTIYELDLRIGNEI